MGAPYMHIVLCQAWMHGRGDVYKLDREVGRNKERMPEGLSFPKPSGMRRAMK